MRDTSPTKSPVKIQTYKKENYDHIKSGYAQQPSSPADQPPLPKTQPKEAQGLAGTYVQDLIKRTSSSVMSLKPPTQKKDNYDLV